MTQTGTTPALKPGNLETVFITKGIAIFLVVWGHYLPQNAPAYWIFSVDAIYRFHMPTFFFLSGYLFAYGGGLAGAGGLGRIIAGKLRRLAYPFFTIALISLGLKLAASRLVHLEHPANAQSIFNLVLDPVHSFMPLLWFMYVIMIMFILFPLGLRIFKKPYYIFGALLVLYFLPWPDIFSLPQLFHNFPFFVGGYLLGRRVNLDCTDFGKLKYLAPIVLAFGLLFHMFHISYNSLSHNALDLLLGFLGIAGVLILSRMILSAGWGNLLRSIGFYSMSIYLLHTLFASPVRILYLKLVASPARLFLAVALVALGLGTYGPLILEKYLLRRFALTRKLILGLN